MFETAIPNLYHHPLCKYVCRNHYYCHRWPILHFLLLNHTGWLHFCFAKVALLFLFSSNGPWWTKSPLVAFVHKYLAHSKWPPRPSKVPRFCHNESCWISESTCLGSEMHLAYFGKALIIFNELSGHQGIQRIISDRKRQLYVTIYSLLLVL